MYIKYFKIIVKSILELDSGNLENVIIYKKKI